MRKIIKRQTKLITKIVKHFYPEHWVEAWPLYGMYQNQHINQLDINQLGLVDLTHLSLYYILLEQTNEFTR